jgi:hypothetical protein
MYNTTKACTIFYLLYTFSDSEPAFVYLLRSPGIDSQPGGIDCSESIPGLLIRLQIRALDICVHRMFCSQRCRHSMEYRGAEEFHQNKIRGKICIFGRDGQKYFCLQKMRYRNLATAERKRKAGCRLFC